MYNDEGNSLIRDLLSLLSHYTFFPMNDQIGAQLSPTEAFDQHCSALSRLQRVSLQSFKDKLTVLALSNYGAIDKREELEALLAPLEDDELVQLAVKLDFRVAYPESLPVTIDRKFIMEVFMTTYERRKSFQESSERLAVVPTEQTLFDSAFQRADTYDGSHPLALPKLNLQYLSLGDFLWRALILYRCEAFYGIRRDIEVALRRLQPESSQPGQTTFSGFSKMAIPISQPS